MTYCVKCGQQVEEGMKFCPECGAEIPVVHKEEKKEQETFTKADVEQMIADALNQKETQKEIQKETMSDALKKLV